MAQESLTARGERYKKRVREFERVAAESDNAKPFCRKEIATVIGTAMHKLLSESDSPDIQIWLKTGCRNYLDVDSVGKLGNNGIYAIACFNHRIPDSVYCSIHDPATKTVRNEKRSKSTQQNKQKGKIQKVKEVK